MLYHLNALISLWLYSFLYEDEPAIKYYKADPSISTLLDYSIKNRISEDFFTIIGSRATKDQLVCLGVAPQNIVEFGGESDELNAKALPQDYVPYFTGFQQHDEAVKEGHKKPNSLSKQTEEADFAPRDHLFGRCQPSKGPIYAYKHPSSPSIITSAKSHTLLTFC